MKFVKKGGRTTALLVSLMLCLLMLTACNATTPPADTTSQYYGNNNSQVAGLDRQMIYGYVMDINEQARTITIDEVELLSAANSDRLQALNLTTADLTNGYYAHNAGVERRMYPLATTVDFDLDSAYNGAEVGEYYNGANDRGTALVMDGTDTGLMGSGTSNNGVANNGNTSVNGVTNDRTNNGVTNNGVTNNGVANNGVTNNGVANNNVTNNNDTALRNGVNGVYDWGMAADQGYDRYDYFGRLNNRISHNRDILYCFTVEDGKVVALRDCSNML